MPTETSITNALQLAQRAPHPHYWSKIIDLLTGEALAPDVLEQIKYALEPWPPRWRHLHVLLDDGSVWDDHHPYRSNLDNKDLCNVFALTCSLTLHFGAAHDYSDPDSAQAARQIDAVARFSTPPWSELRVVELDTLWLGWYALEEQWLVLAERVGQLASLRHLTFSERATTLPTTLNVPALRQRSPLFARAYLQRLREGD